MLDFTSIGSVNSYLKNMDMQQKWDQKQRTGNYKADGIKTASEWIENQKNNIKEKEESTGNDKVLTGIKDKFYAGSRLTSSELQYLQKKDPVAYQQAAAAERERRIYERELRMCRTKEDVQKYKMSHTVRALENVKSTMNNSSVSKDKKVESVLGEHQKMSAVNAAERDFVRSGEYSRLPSEAEKLKAERDMRRAKREESRAAAEKRAEKKSEEAERREKLRQKKEAAKKDIEEKKIKGKHKKKVKNFSRSKKKFRAKKAAYTTQQAQNTAEARKVRYANAKVAYEQSRAGTARAIISGEKDLDIRA